jgi:hypothetical protein
MTTYYVRTIADDFDFNIDSGAQTPCYSRTTHFEIYTEPALGATYEDWGHKTNRMFSTVNQTLYAFCDVEGIATLTNRLRPPAKSTISSSNVLVQTGTTGTIYWCDWEANPNQSQGWGMEGWGQRGWTNPFQDYSTWINEICNAFDTINIQSVATNFNRINVVIFKYKFNNRPENDRYMLFPVFYVGDDPNYDTTVVI